MTSITIGNLDRQVYEQLRIVAQENGHSMDDEACRILTQAFETSADVGGLGTRISSRFRGGLQVDLDLPSR
ncbi:Arc family DNA-binding protein [Pseudomonas sp. 681]|uniref:Arc family DNA-binding protein n=1 Tax=Pseudomonas fungipugnans TaxID=3024217 RepID=A0ABT6QSG6_9PSED|nr:Arc family DNA-binding protein [Pseudomonas sp. 681]MDI2593676.1 Arc family DNA-binding protein [Pseudomonas sp. 681]